MRQETFEQKLIALAKKATSVKEFYDGFEFTVKDTTIQIKVSTYLTGGVARKEARVGSFDASGESTNCGVISESTFSHILSIIKELVHNKQREREQHLINKNRENLFKGME